MNYLFSYFHSHNKGLLLLILLLSMGVYGCDIPDIEATETAEAEETSSPNYRRDETPASSVRRLEETRYVNTTTLNVREEPSKNSTILGQLSYRDEMAVVGSVQKPDGLWYRVEFESDDSDHGYVFASLTSATRPAAQQTQQTGGGGGNSGGVSCGGATTCGQMTSCAQAYACLQAGNSRLDADGDGIPCESICQ